jgi:hypothetical protein
MYGAFGGSICMWYIAAYIKIAEPTKHVNKSGQLSSGGISAIFFFYLWTAFYTPSWNGTPWVINSEMYSQQTRSLGQAFAACKFLHHPNTSIPLITITNIDISQQLVLEFHYLAFHTSNVSQDVIRRLHVLRMPHASLDPIRLLPHS